MVITAIAAVAVLASHCAHARDLGVIGPVYAIAEPSLLEVLPPLLAGLPRFRDEAAFLALVAGSLVLYPALVLGLIGRARLMGLLRGTPTAR